MKCKTKRIQGLFLGNVEVWKDIKGYENVYQVSSFGNVRSLERYKQGPRGTLRLVKGTLLKLRTKKSGYLDVHLRTLKNLYPSVHTLVAKTFLPNPDNKRTVNHKNGIKTDNNISNLEWATESEQMLHAIQLGLYTPPDITKYSKKGEEANASKLKQEDILKIKELRKEGNTYKNISLKFNIGISQVFRICKNQSWGWLHE